MTGVRTASTTERKRLVVLLIALAAVTLAAYWPVLRCDFTNYDDPIYVTKNAQVQRGLTPDGIDWALTAREAGNWHPLTWVSLMVDLRVFYSLPNGSVTQAALVHGVNLLLHVLNVLLLCLLLFRLTGRLWVAGFAALLFAVHPLHVQSVAWVTERKDVLSTFFLLLTLLAYIRYVCTTGVDAAAGDAGQSRAKGRSRAARRTAVGATDLPVQRSPFGRSSYWLVVALLALGLMAKPMLVTLPVLLLLLDWWPLDRPKTTGWRALVMEKLPMLPLVIGSGIATLWAQRASGAVTGLHWLPLGVRLANSAVACVAYIGKMLWPSRLAVLYPHPNRSLPSWQVMGASALIVAITVLAIRLRKKAPYALVGWLWYIITLLPVIGIVQVGEQAMADRYTYVPLIGLFTMLSLAIPQVLCSVLSRRAATAAGCIAVTCVAVALVICTRVQIGFWRNSLSLWTRAVNVTSANPLAESNLADALCKLRRYDEALPHLQKAVRLLPRYGLANYGLGLALANKSRWREAVPYLRVAARELPARADVRGNLAVVLTETGQYDEALSEAQAALNLEPNNPQLQALRQSVIQQVQHQTTRPY